LGICSDLVATFDTNSGGGFDNRLRILDAILSNVFGDLGTGFTSDGCIRWECRSCLGEPLGSTEASRDGTRRDPKVGGLTVWVNGRVLHWTREVGFNIVADVLTRLLQRVFRDIDRVAKFPTRIRDDLSRAI
jgi:hypothetical protein